jgi:hypothetical protein
LPPPEHPVPTTTWDLSFLQSGSVVNGINGGIAAVEVAAMILTAKSGYRAVRSTSLLTAWNWLLAAEGAVVVMTLTDLVAGLWPGRSADYGWCFTSILLLCPPIAALGARRPGVRVWSLFILLPMVVVLSWPIWTLVLQGAEMRGLALETPTIVGFLLVLLMGSGNYLGTRFASSCVLWFLGTLDLFLTCTGWEIWPDGFAPYRRQTAVCLLSLAVCLAWLNLPRTRARNPINRLWDDFRHHFGLMWALRMVERINALAIQEGWTARISLDGFPETAEGRLTFNETEIERAFRWLFRRFVDDAWIADRIGPESAESFSADEHRNEGPFAGNPQSK